ncbi:MULTISPECIES: hypothetical protein [unclassified Streptomyces]|uniref:hypothetical protein n=1 Tax=unclassified Streptomyces TaxID=2593676 RepID=UPI0006ADF089|nr:MULTISPECIES: hypothetical protein [unclassified Streptomyces]KOX25701.1 hypothetical protein ADL06_17930 [Streptomyces sp. NRRL F-6491]KOX49204.1 hypothetical protein ADL08_08965 [Streptomyces sp. NRRL F-6492]
MNHSENTGQNIDQDAVLRARTMLLGSGRLGLAQEVEAYRVLARVSPAAYLPKLAGALGRYGDEVGRRRGPERELVLYAEAVDAARRIGADHPRRTDLLLGALRDYERTLFELGRRAEGRAVCEEMAEAGRLGFERGQAAYPERGSGRLAVVLAEEGRHGEAADLRMRGAGAETEDSFWSAVARAAELEAAGRREEAVAVFTGLVDDTRRETESGSAPLARLVWELVHRSRMLDAAGRHGEAGADRREALAVLDRLAESGEPRNWSDILSWWTTPYALSARTAEPPASPEAPAPAFGTHLHRWSRDTRKAYFDGVPALEAEAARLSAAGRLTELAAVHRRLTVRSALFHENRTHRIEEPLRPLFDEEVALARRSAEGLPRALTDRAMFLVAAERYQEARADFAEAVGLFGGADRTPIVTAT